jgi:uncharacterized protein YbdZ (MbtH family)
MMTKGRDKKERHDKSRNLSQNDSIESLSEPSSGLFLLDAVGCTSSASSLLSLRYPESRAAHDSNHVHTEDTDTRVVFDSQVNVLSDTESKVSSVGEVSSSQLVFLDLETTFENFFSLWSTNGDVASNLLVTSDSESSEGCSRHASKKWQSRQILSLAFSKAKG